MKLNKYQQDILFKLEDAIFPIVLDVVQHNITLQEASKKAGISYTLCKLIFEETEQHHHKRFNDILTRL